MVNSMDSVGTFVRYQSIMGTDPFDDFRMLEFNSKLFINGIDASPYIKLLSEMASAIIYSRTRNPIENYYFSDEIEMMDAISIVISSFESVIVDDKPKTKNNNLNVDESLIEIVNKNKADDVTDIQQRLIMRHTASQKKNALFMLLSNCIQVGMSIESILNMEYEQAVNLINFRAKKLEDDNKKMNNKRR